MSVLHLDDSWQVKAECRGPQADLFFPPPHFEKKDAREARERQAKSICATCSVSKECLEYSIQIREPHGVWGGLNEAERKQIMLAEEAS
jgi:WhiB family transcriptional regulator, redox-sensing transcriptional regulator